ncbi:flagellar basal body-associated FliL family protein [Accumulibacter sp.]|uniref:flagellar basal body-associated FliL family protein n=1 Tax=Accumulibacter sp. TaxID=2053492 RepID=UPI002634A162|nr:flagellar basal body-associated FliL family protein [Accumulibacter sp.]
MANDAKPGADSGHAAPAKSSKKLLIIIVAVLVLVLGVGGVGAFLLLKPAAEYDEEHGDSPAEKAKPVKKKKADRNAAPIYVALDAFTVNLVPETGDQFLQLILSVEVEDSQTDEQLKQYMPKLRNDVTLLLSSKKASELVTINGKRALAEEIKEQMNGVLDPAGKGKKRDSPIKEVLFTSFIIQ